MSAASYKILELFSGIGGMHTAMIETTLPFTQVGSYEINPTAIQIYRHNFSDCRRFKERNIMGLNVEEFENLDADVILMSPPCQPFTRQGLQKDVEDNRCSPLLHFLSVLKGSRKVPDKILLENVAGFETSVAHQYLVEVLKEKNYIIQEFLISPSDVGITNSRLRFYLLAKRHTESFCFPIQKEIHVKSLPVCVCLYSDEECQRTQPKEFQVCSMCEKTRIVSVSKLCRKFRDKYLVNKLEINSLLDVRLHLKNFVPSLENPEPYLVPKKLLTKYAKVFDIVHPDSQGSCCFTKGYGHYVQGTGSVMQHNTSVDSHNVYSQLDKLNPEDPLYYELLSSLQLRYFTPKEMLSLMSYPDYFSIPKECSTKQAYKAIGNSVNVFIVTALLLILMEE